MYSASAERRRPSGWPSHRPGDLERAVQHDLMRIQFILPDPRLAQLVKGYVAVEDLAGIFANHVVRTCPEPLAVVSANLGKGALDWSGQVHPRTAFLGVQTKACQWIPQSETYFVAAFLTIPGLISLFPMTGRETANALVALDDLMGAKAARTLYDSVPDNFDTNLIKKQMDGWFLDRLNNCSVDLVEHATWLFTSLVASRNIEATCATAGISTRTLQRFFGRHVGVCPRMVLNLDRLQSSVSDVQSRGTDRSSGVGDFADQAHQIRTWQRFLQATPSVYRRSGVSMPARLLTTQFRAGADRPVFWL